LHVPIGGRIINLGKRFVSTNFEKFIVILLAMAGSVIAAWLFYNLIEKPSHRLSRRIKLNVAKD